MPKKIVVDLSEKKLNDTDLEEYLNEYQDDTVSYLELGLNNLTSLSSKILNQFILRQKNTLEKLVLTGNPLGSDGVTVLASVINESKIKVLRLSDCNIEDCEAKKGIVELCEKLKTNTRLEDLSFSNNVLTREAFSAIIGMLKVNSALKFLHLTDCGLVRFEERMDAFFKAVKKHPTLKGADILSNRLEGKYYSEAVKFWASKHPNQTIKSTNKSPHGDNPNKVEFNKCTIL